jgi:hypothetical protein
MEDSMYKSEYEVFINNSIWKEVVSTLEEVSRSLVEDLKNIDPVLNAGLMAKQQGRLLMAEFILSIPADILREIEEIEDKKIKQEREES